MEVSYTRTRLSCYVSYVTQAVVNGLLPLLFVTIQSSYGISLDKIALLISLNFGIQLVVDILSVKFVDKIGYRASAIMAGAFATVGLLGIGILPQIMPDAYIGLVLAVSLSAVGGGIVEVLISPIIDSLPGTGKAASMSFLHSFYCWGSVAVVLVSTLFFNIAGIENWAILPMLWAAVPILSMILFSKAPLMPMVSEHERVPLKKLFSRKLFFLFIILLACAGASEQAMSQWASMFAELGLGVSKTMGDLLGPCAFALFMGIARLMYGIWGKNWKLEKALLVSALLCVASYMLAVFSPIPMLSLAGCTLCGFSVGLMWPGTFSLTSRNFPTGGTAMFAVLAIGGDLGCAAGPAVVGFVSDASERGLFSVIQSWFTGASETEAGLKIGLLAASVFSIIMVFGLVALHFRNKRIKMLAHR